MDLPPDLRQALARELEGTAPKALAARVAALSDRYRAAEPPSGAFMRSSGDAMAYAAYRLPATYAAVRAALEEVAAALPGWQPRTLLDLGSGPGTALWAASGVWPGLERAVLVERDDGMIALGQRLAAQASARVVREASWQRADLLGSWDTGPCDLAIAAYVLGELAPGSHEALVERLWQHRAGVVLIIEPGTPRGFEAIRRARAHLIELNGHVVAPCPHDDPCPMTEGDWCHFAQRVTRTALHRTVKGGALGYEDEKFSYVAVSRMRGRPIAGRVLRHPQTRKGHVILELCTPDGLRRRTVSRKEGPTYRQARDLRWGSAINADTDTDMGAEEQQ